MKGCPDNPVTIGEHLKKARIELGLKQEELADRLGVHRGSIQLWERGIGEQGVKVLPAIIRFLGYVPFACEATSGGQFRFLRNCCGKTQEKLADLAGCDASSVARWENGMIDAAKKFDATVLRIWEELRTLGVDSIVTSSLCAHGMRERV